MQSKIINYMKFIVSMMIMGLGIVLVTKSNLGTSAISSIPFVLSQIFTLSFVFFTFLLNLIYILIQIIFLNNKFEKQQYLQVLVGLLLGFFIDFWMFIFLDLHPSVYFFKLIILIGGCIVVGIGVFGQLAANVVNNPIDGVVKLVSIN